MDHLRERAVYLAAIDKWGRTGQILKAIEELGELSTALSRALNGISRTSREVDTEIADVEIMLEQLKIIFGVEGVDFERREKLEHLAQLVGFDSEPPRSGAI